MKNIIVKNRTSVRKQLSINRRLYEKKSVIYSGGGSLAHTFYSVCRRKKISRCSCFYYTYSDTYITSVRSALNKAFSEKNISYQDYDSNSNQTTQTEQVQTAITKGAKVIVVNIVNTGSNDAANGIVSLAKNAGIPLYSSTARFLTMLEKL